jgi:hypothetical protein
MPVHATVTTGDVEVRFAALTSPLAPHAVFITEAAVRWIDLLASVSNRGELVAFTPRPTTGRSKRV